MQINVAVPNSDGSAFMTETHTAELIDHDTSDGELRVILRDRDGRATGWTLYAAGQWVRAILVEPVDPEVARHRAAAAERDRTPPPNGGSGFGPVGNSGPH